LKKKKKMAAPDEGAELQEQAVLTLPNGKQHKIKVYKGSLGGK
jgi:hypothetical protein